VSSDDKPVHERPVRYSSGRSFLDWLSVMKFHVAWILADEQKADWSHLATRDIDGMDMNKLERLLRPNARAEDARKTVLQLDVV
jgi:hypothetical protein